MADVRALLDFSSIAVVGASESGAYGAAPFAALRAVGYAGAYLPVNPRREQVHGVRAYPSVGDIPGAIDLALIAVPRDHVLAALEEAAAKGARAAVVVSANFAETDEQGAQLQARIAALAAEHDLALLGPNCVGAASLVHRTAAFTGSGLGRLHAGNVGVVANSGGLLFEVMSFGAGRGIGFSHLLSSGNEAGVTSADAIDFFVGDPNTDVILAVIEAVRKQDLFVAAAERAVAARKPLVILKLGASEKGARSALTHTGALAGSDAVHSALFRQKGILRVHDLDELIELGALLSPAVAILRKRPLERTAIIEISGGGTELLCDTAAAAGVALPELSQATVAVLRTVLPSHVKPGNPVDSGSSWSRKDMDDIYPLALRALAGQSDVDVVVSRYTIPRGGELGVLGQRLNELVAARREHPDRLFAVLSRTSDQFSEDWAAAVAEHGLTFLQGYGRGMRALGKLAEYSAYLGRPRDRREPRPVRTRPRPGVGALNEVDAKDVLRDIGLPVAPTIWARSAQEAVRAANGLGYPVVAKVISPQILHKSDAGGVRLGLTDAGAVELAFRELSALAGFEGAAIQPLAPPGIEIVLGAHRDAQFGPVIMFGLGGIFVEVLADVALRVAPLSLTDAGEMLDEVRAAAVLRGARNRPPVAREPIVEALCLLSDLMLAEPGITSVDLNPALVYPDGMLVVDARMVR